MSFLCRCCALSPGIAAQFYLLLKAQGMLVKDHPVITKLVEARTCMEKLRPLDAKLKYQMDKLLKSADAPEAASAGKLRARAELT